MGFRPLSVKELAGITASLRKADRASTPDAKPSEEVVHAAPVETQVETAPAPAEEATAVSPAIKSGFKKKSS
jgi:hypothetical protein